MRHWKKKPWVDSEVRNWDYIADHLAPDATIADAGKVLTVGETGKPEWGEGGGSGGGAMFMLFVPDQDDQLISNFPIDDFISAYNNHVPIFASFDGVESMMLTGVYVEDGFCMGDTAPRINLVSGTEFDISYYVVTNDENDIFHAEMTRYTITGQ